MDALAFEHHLTSPQGEGHVPPDAFTVTFGGGECCDEVTFHIQTDGTHVTDAGFTADGCGSSHAAASAAVTLVRGSTLLDAARIGQTQIAQELGGLSPGKIHAAAVAADALARALGAATRARGALPGPAGPGATRTLVAMSGGVDSSVAALLCARDSDVVAVTLELWSDAENDVHKSCCSSSAVSQARALAHSLGLPHFTLDLREEFTRGVVEPFIAAYGAGDTPNPCVGCNGHVRLDAMLDFADRLGAATLATGHYARIEPGTSADRPLLRAAADPGKDQTYMLAALAPDSLARMRFPLGEYEKPQVREIARAAGLPVATKADSQDLCFLAGTTRERFLRRHGTLAPEPGEVVDSQGTVLATHDGHELFTVGQRRGLNVSSAEPLYVLDKDAERNRVVVGPHERLLTDTVRVRGARLHRDATHVNRVKLRYRSEPLPARVSGELGPGSHRELTLDLLEPVAGAAPGQLACLMDGELIVGWAPSRAERLGPELIHTLRPAMAMTSDEIRDTYRTFFEERGHLAQRGASLIPPPNDTSALFIVAGMHPLKAYFAGTEQPPARRLTTCQPAFRTNDIENVGMTARHLTLFEMLGNFSFGDYFKREAIAFAWDLSRNGFGLREEDIWVTVFGGDERLGIGPDQEAIDLWLEAGMPRERIVECPRSENFWESGPTGPCGPDSELYLDLGLSRGKPDDLPGGENERFLEFWNLVFMQYDQNPADTVTPLPNQNIDTGLGLNRMAAILQGKETVFETDQFAPLIALGEELSGRRYGQDFATDRALRILADHSRAATFLVADGVVPSNEERGYVLRRIMRRAILQGRETLGLDPGFLRRYQDAVTELMGAEYSQLVAQRESVAKWFTAEEEGFGRTLVEGLKLLEDLIDTAKQNGDEGISASDAFKLHDTHGFPFDLTLELVAQHDLGVDDQGFEALMEEQRRQSRASGARTVAGSDLREQAAALVAQSEFKTEFQGYEKTTVQTTVGTVAASGTEGRLLVKLLESPFYATGGGQVADGGYLECEDGDCLVKIEDVLRVGDDQVLAVSAQRGTLRDGERVHARVDGAARHATAANHTATHLLHAALRARLGNHVHQAGSYVGPDKLRFDFTHTSGLSREELTDVEDQVNAWILEALPVRWLTTTLDEARSLGAMALFGEKYGEIVRMVEVGDGSFSRELCGGTHVRNTAQIALLKITAETSSAANVRRIEAITGPAGVALMRSHDRALTSVADTLRLLPEAAPAAVGQLRDRVRELERQQKSGANGSGPDLEALIAGAVPLDGATVLTVVVDGVGGQDLLDLADRLKAKLGDAAIVLGVAADGKVDIVAAVAPALVQRGVKAGDIVRAAAAVVGGGGGGRDTAARAGGRDVAKLGEAIDVARTTIERALAG